MCPYVSTSLIPGSFAQMGLDHFAAGNAEPAFGQSEDQAAREVARKLGLSWPIDGHPLEVLVDLVRAGENRWGEGRPRAA